MPPPAVASPALRTVAATRYVTPLREGGSLPAVVEADDDGLYVVKFTAAGQGVKALAAEIIAGEIARALGLLVPEIVFVELDPALADAEPDPEIQELIARSAGVNLGFDFLPSALAFPPRASPGIAPELAADVVWFDALVTNIDRTPRNPNLLLWHERLWLIDHGAALYFHHAPSPSVASARLPFAGIADHVLLAQAGPVEDADERLAPRLPAELLEAIVAAVPDPWVASDDGAAPEDGRGLYTDWLAERLAPPREFARAAEHERAGA